MDIYRQKERKRVKQQVWSSIIWNTSDRIVSIRTLACLLALVVECSITEFQNPCSKFSLFKEDRESRNLDLTNLFRLTESFDQWNLMEAGGGSESPDEPKKGKSKTPRKPKESILKQSIFSLFSDFDLLFFYFY